MNIYVICDLNNSSVDLSGPESEFGLLDGVVSSEADIYFGQGAATGTRYGMGPRRLLPSTGHGSL